MEVKEDTTLKNYLKLNKRLIDLEERVAILEMKTRP